MKRYHSDLTKVEYHGGIALLYGRDSAKLTSLSACNGNFTVAHALHHSKGENTNIRQNVLRDSFANLLSDVCHDGEMETDLQPLQGEIFALISVTTDGDAWLDINADGQWESRVQQNPFLTRRQKVALKAVAKPTSTINLLKQV